nr:uncharacterized protein LOC123278594 isoform X1 [Equus asinus]
MPRPNARWVSSHLQPRPPGSATSSARSSAHRAGSILHLGPGADSGPNPDAEPSRGPSAPRNSRSEVAERSRLLQRRSPAPSQPRSRQEAEVTSQFAAVPAAPTAVHIEAVPVSCGPAQLGVGERLHSSLVTFLQEEEDFRLSGGLTAVCVRVLTHLALQASPVSAGKGGSRRLCFLSYAEECFI